LTQKSGAGAAVQKHVVSILVAAAGVALGMLIYPRIASALAKK